MTYSRDEIESVVDQVLKSGLSRENTALGTRHTESTFADFQQAVAQLFVHQIKAPYHFLNQGRKLLQEQVSTEIEILNELLTAVMATQKQIEPITDMSPIVQARTAVQELSSALLLRKKAPTTIDKIPSYIRFKKNIETFIQGPSQQLKGVDEKGAAAVLPTPQEAKKSIPTLIRSLEAAHTETKRRVALLVNAPAELSSLQLPVTLAKKAVGNVGTMLKAREDDWKIKTPELRRQDLKQTTLELLVAKTVVSQYAGYSAPSEIHPIEGDGGPYADESKPANPATVDGDKSGPFVITSANNQLEILTENMTVPEYISLNTCLYPSMDGSLLEPFTIPGTPCYFMLRVTNQQITSSIAVDLSAEIGVGSYDAVTFKAALNPILSPYNLQITSALSALKYAGATYEIISQVFDTPYWVLVIRCVGADFTQQQVLVDDVVLMTTAISAGFEDIEHTDWVVTQVAPGGNVDRLEIKRAMAVPVALAGLPSSPAAPHSINIQIATRFKLRIEPISVDTAISSRMILEVPVDSTDIVGPPDGTQNQGAQLLGFILGATFETRFVLGSEVAKDISSKSSIITAKAVFTTSHPEFWGYSDVTDPSKMQVSRVQRKQSTITLESGQYFLNRTQGDLLSAGVTAGDVVVGRSGVNNLQSFSIAEVVSSTKLRLDGTPTVTTNFVYDIAPNPGMVSVVSPQMIARVSSGPNTQDFVLQTYGSYPDEVLILGIMPVYRVQGLPTASEFKVRFGQETIQFSSKDKTTSSAIKIQGAASSLFNYAWPPLDTDAKTPGTSNWVSSPALPSAVETGDVLKVFGSSYKTPDSTHTIVKLERSTKRFQISPPLDSSKGLTFSTKKQPPFAQIHMSHSSSYLDFSSALSKWLTSVSLHPENKENAFKNLYAAINPIISSNQPSSVQISVAREAVLIFLKGLDAEAATRYGVDPEQSLSSILQSYNADTVSACISLQRAYHEKGSTRALDILCEGRFKEFFELDMEGSSYNGQLQKTYKAVMQNDLPVRKTDRKIQPASKIIAQIESPDYEYSTADLDKTPGPDYPAVNGVPDNMPNFFGL